MPLTQTALRFATINAMPSSSTQSPALSRASTASSDTLPCPQLDADTIIVARPQLVQQLPTPSESSAELSSDKGLLEVISSPQRRAGARLNDLNHEGGKDSEATSQASKGPSNVTSRAVSSETLISNEHQPQSSLLRDGISALNLPWSMSSLFNHEGDLDEPTSDHNKFQSLESLLPEPTPTSSQAAVTSKQTRAERVEKIRQNDANRLAKIKDADSRAIRRSSRVPILQQAGDAISELTTNVLGKRTRDVMEKSKDALGELKRRTSLRQQSIVPRSTSTSAPGFEGPTKKRRLDKDGDEKIAEAPKPVAPRRKHKRFLNAGLYTGQSRHFDGRLTTSKNKRKALLQDQQQEKENLVLPLPMFAGERLLNVGRDFRLPFSIFSPLPPGQPKPDEWRKVNKNVFVREAGSIWRTSKFAEHSTCMCTSETGCDEDCQNRFMFYECDDRNCNLGAERCGNRSFAGLKERVKRGGKFNIGVEVIKTADRGYGVRSNRCFEPNQIIVEYTGEIITQEECESRMRERYKDNECYYLMLFDQNMIIDATRGSIARFVNHSCEPNCRMEKWTVDGKPRMALFAGEAGIETGEELTYDYNFDPFSQKNVQECRCGSERCRGVLGPRPKEERKHKAGKGEDKEKERVQDLEKDKKDREAHGTKGLLAGAKRKISYVLEEGSNLVNKRRKMPATATGDSAHARTKPRTSQPSKRPTISRNPSSSITVAQAERKPASTSRLQRMLLGSSRISASSTKSKTTSRRTASFKATKDTVNVNKVSASEEENEQLLHLKEDKGRKLKQPFRPRGSVRARAASVINTTVKTVKDATSDKMLDEDIVCHSPLTASLDVGGKDLGGVGIELGEEIV